MSLGCEEYTRSSRACPPATPISHNATRVGKLSLTTSIADGRDDAKRGCWSWRATWPNGERIAYDHGRLPTGQLGIENLIDWVALASGLEWLAGAPAAFESATVYAANEKVVDQIAGRRRQKSACLQTIYSQCRQLVERLNPGRLEFVVSSSEKSSTKKSKAKGKSRKKAGRPARRQQPSRWLAAGQHCAGRRGFFILESGPTSPTWQIYDEASGEQVCRYWPQSGDLVGVGQLAGHRGAESGFGALFADLRQQLEATAGRPTA